MHMHEHKVNTFKQSCKAKQQPATPEQQKRCQTRHHQTARHNRNLVKTRHQKTHTKASEKIRHWVKTDHTLRKIINLNCT